MERPTEGDPDTSKDQEEHLTPDTFVSLFTRACLNPDQVWGQCQQGSTGQFKSKCLRELSWRGLLKKLFIDCEDLFTIACKCDGEKTKNTAQAVIKHIERRHQKKK